MLDTFPIEQGQDLVKGCASLSQYVIGTVSSTSWNDTIHALVWTSKLWHKAEFPCSHHSTSLPSLKGCMYPYKLKETLHGRPPKPQQPWRTWDWSTSSNRKWGKSAPTVSVWLDSWSRIYLDNQLLRNSTWLGLQKSDKTLIICMMSPPSFLPCVQAWTDSIEDLQSPQAMHGDSAPFHPAYSGANLYTHNK